MRTCLRKLAAGASVSWLAAFGVSQAAERADPPAAPRLGVCGVGSGGFLLPGTDACLKIGGLVRAEASWAMASPGLALAAPRGTPKEARAAADGDFGRTAFGTSARLFADMHVPTELGPVRVFVSLRAHNGVATDRAAH